MIDEIKFPEYREKVFQYIQKEILPKYPEIESCNMHKLPVYMNWDVEYIFKIKYRLRDLFKRNKSQKILDDEVYVLVSQFCKRNGFPYYILNILIIFKE